MKSASILLFLTMTLSFSAFADTVFNDFQLTTEVDCTSPFLKILHARVTLRRSPLGTGSQSLEFLSVLANGIVVAREPVVSHVYGTDEIFTTANLTLTVQRNMPEGQLRGVLDNHANTNIPAKSFMGCRTLR